MAVRKFNNLAEINQFLTKETKVALEKTLQVLAPRLKYFIRKDVYWAYSPTFYKRTRWLMRSGVIDYYISNLQNLIRGGVRINRSMYKSLYNGEKFQHGNPYRMLDVDTFIGILNDEEDGGYFNPFGFPYIIRQSFWEEYTDWVKDNYAEIFQRKCKNQGIDLNNLGATESSSPEPPKGEKPSPEPPNTTVTGTSNDIGRTTIGNNRPQGGFVNRFVKQSALQGKSNSFMESAMRQASVGQYDEMRIGSLDIKIGEQGLSGNRI